MMLELDIDFAGAEAAVAKLHATPKAAERANISTCQRMAQWVATRIKRLLMSVVGLSAESAFKRVRGIRIKKRAGSYGATIHVRLNPAPLTSLGGTASKAGITFRGGRDPHAFIASSTKRNKPKAYKRAGQDRLPIRFATHPIYEPAEAAISALLASDGFVREFQRQFERVFNHNLRRVA